MKGNVVTAAKLFCVSMIFSALILAFGINLAVALQRVKPAETTATVATESSKPFDWSGFFSQVFERYSSDPNERMAELLVESENLRQIDAEKRRFWLLTDPAALTYERITGTVEDAEPVPEVTPIICPPPENPTTDLGFFQTPFYKASQQRLAEWVNGLLLPRSETTMSVSDGRETYVPFRPGFVPSAPSEVDPIQLSIPTQPLFRSKLEPSEEVMAELRRKIAQEARYREPEKKASAPEVTPIICPPPETVEPTSTQPLQLEPSEARRFEVLGTEAEARTRIAKEWREMEPEQKAPADVVPIPCPKK